MFSGCEWTVTLTLTSPNEVEWDEVADEEVEAVEGECGQVGGGGSA